MSSVLLLDEPVIAVQPSLVRRLDSVLDACVVQQIHYWLQRSANQHRGELWVYKTYEDWSAEIGVSARRIQVSMRRLEKCGLIVSCQPEAYHRRKWYRIDYTHPLLDPSNNPESSNAPSCVMEQTDRCDGTDGSVRSSTETTQENTQENTTRNSLAVLEPHLVTAQRLANLLADLIEQNGSRRPNVTNKWVSTIDRMIRIDGRTEQQIEGAIRWCQDDDFWRANIMSPDKLRKQYDRLRLQASRSEKSTRGLDGVRAYLDSI